MEHPVQIDVLDETRWMMHTARVCKWKLILPDRTESFRYDDDRGSQEAALYDLESGQGVSTIGWTRINNLANSL